MEEERGRGNKEEVLAYRGKYKQTRNLVIDKERERERERERKKERERERERERRGEREEQTYLSSSETSLSS